MTALNILVIHGISWGEGGTHYARPLQENIQREFDRAIHRLRLRDVSSADARADQALRFEVSFWGPITQRPQDSLLKVMYGKRLFFRRLDPTYLLRRNLVSLLGDVIAYEYGPADKVYQAIHAEVAKSMQALGEASAAERGDSGFAPLTIIGYSLGSVIGSDHVWDHSRQSDPAHHLPDYHLSLTNYISMGSPLAMYALRNNVGGGQDSIRESLDSPIHVDPDGGLWLNLYSPHDAVAFPLEPFKAYHAAGVVDCPIRAGSWLTQWNLLSHAGYWRSEEAARVIGRKLALDWARLNSPQFAEHDYQKALDSYRKELCAL
jgi:hypothetical protein